MNIKCLADRVKHTYLSGNAVWLDYSYVVLFSETIPTTDVGTHICNTAFLFCGAAAQIGPRPPPFWRFQITRRHTTIGTTPLDEWSVHRRDLYLTTQKHSQETNIHAPGEIRTHDPSKRSAEGPRLRPRGLCNRHIAPSTQLYCYVLYCFILLGNMFRWTLIIPHYN
jgi:hypothetical protein